MFFARFNLLDRTGDGTIDTEEYEYVLSEFGVKEKDSRQCFQMFTSHFAQPLDFTLFVRLFEEYYLSDDPADLGQKYSVIFFCFCLVFVQHDRLTDDRQTQTDRKSGRQKIRQTEN